MTALFCSRSLTITRHPYLTSSRLYHVGKASSVNTAILRGLRKSKGLALRGKSTPDPNDPRERLKERIDGLPNVKVRPERPARKQAEVTRGGWPSGKSLQVRSSGSQDLRGQQEDRRKSSRRSSSKRDVEESRVKGFGRPTSSRAGTGGRNSQGFLGGKRDSGEARKSSLERRSSNRFGSRGRNEDPLQDFDSTSRGIEDSRNFGESRESGPRRHKSESFQPRRGGRDSKETYYGDLEGRKSDPFRSKRDNRWSQDSTYSGSDGKTTNAFGIRQDNKESRSGGYSGYQAESSLQHSVEYEDRGQHTRADHRTTANERWSTDRFRSEGTSTAARYAAHRDGVNPTSSRTSSGEYYSQEVHKPDESPAPIKRILDRNIPLSIPYTTPASEFLYGTSVVEAALRSRRSPRRQLYKLYIYDGENRENHEQDDEFERLAQSQNVPVMRVGPDWSRFMEKISTGRPHNGYILEASPLPRLPITSLGEVTTQEEQDGFNVTLDHQSKEEAAVNGTAPFIRIAKNHHGRNPLVLFLDSIVDPANLGSIVRTASFLGVSALAISARNSASFTPVVLKASAGASENMTLLSVNKPAGFIADSKAAGWKVYAAVAPDSAGQHAITPSVPVDELKDPLAEAPCILMLGNEGDGLRWNLRSKADVDLFIRGSGWRGSVDSLNVNVAAGILCSAFIKRGKVVKEVKEIPKMGDLF